MSDLKRIQKMATLLLEQEAEVIRLEKELEEAQKKFDQTERIDLPELMAEVGLLDFTLEDGRGIVIDSNITTSLTEEKKDAALNWLHANDYEGIIKTQITLSFSKGERELAEEARLKIAQDYPDVVVDETVHHSTLKSFVKERLEEGDPLPLETFSVIEFKKAKITNPPKPKGKK